MGEKDQPGALPPLPAGAPGRPQENRYREQYGVIVICEDEGRQQTIYDALKALSAEPMKLRVVVT